MLFKKKHWQKHFNNFKKKCFFNFNKFKLQVIIETHHIGSCNGQPKVCLVLLHWDCNSQ